MAALPEGDVWREIWPSPSSANGNIAIGTLTAQLHKCDALSALAQARLTHITTE
jgi:hypothetical protein